MPGVPQGGVRARPQHDEVRGAAGDLAGELDLCSDLEAAVDGAEGAHFQRRLRRLRARQRDAHELDPRPPVLEGPRGLRVVRRLLRRGRLLHGHEELDGEVGPGLARDRLRSGAGTVQSWPRGYQLAVLYWALSGSCCEHVGDVLAPCAWLPREAVAHLRISARGQPRLRLRVRSGVHQEDPGVSDDLQQGPRPASAAQALRLPARELRGALRQTRRVYDLPRGGGPALRRPVPAPRPRDAWK
mmetsp:Transcript_50125/g.142078  ORF Transcript_50125/g.142078 Transcript_50125/m.142078 type:complete len:243 (-) Transcript_50125:276-1004(-)